VPHQLRLAPLAALAALLALFLPASGPQAGSGTLLRGLTLRQQILPPLNLSKLLQGEDTPADTFLVCQWYSGRQLVAVVKVGDGTVPSGESARKYLSREIAASSHRLTLSEDIPWFEAGVAGVESAAEFGTARTTAGLESSVWSVVVNNGLYEQVTVSCLEPGGAEGPVEAFARAVYNWWT
jgi:hypothetical protein